MRKLLSLALAMPLFFCNSYSQKVPPIITQIITPTNGRPTDVLINCTNVVNNNCNRILNNNFAPGLNYATPTDPFSMNEVPNWVPPGGTPTIYDPVAFPGNWYTTPPPQATSYAFMGSANDVNIGPIVESVAQNIKPVQAGHIYFLTFYKQRKNYTQQGLGAYPVDFFDIYLFNCSDFNTYFPPNPLHSPPTVPPNSQHIYCETSVVNDTWERVAVKFTANQNYDMIWFSPTEDFSLGAPRYSGLYVTLPELIDVTNFTAGPFIPGTQPTCMGQIGTTNNCAPTDALFTWFNPANQFYSSGTTSLLSIDVTNPANQGTWTLTMTVSGTSFSNNTCSQTATVSAQVTVTNTCNAFTGWPKSYLGENFYYALKSTGGNMFTSIGGDMLTNVNHNGVLPPGQGLYSVQYDQTSGNTNWVMNNVTPQFALSSGNVQMRHWYTSATSYVNGATGAAASAPPLVPANDLIIGETTNGGYVTIANNQLHIYTSTGNNSVNYITNAYGIRNTYYNPNSSPSKLYVDYTGYTYNRAFAVYNVDINNNTITLANTPTFSISPFNYILFNVNNNDEVFYWSSSNQIMKYNYSTGNFTLFSAAGFTNSYIFSSYDRLGNRYTSDNILVAKEDENKMYFINTVTGQFKTMTYSLMGFPWFPEYDYIYDNNYIYLVGDLEGATPGPGHVQLGNQLVYYWNDVNIPIYISTFITKFSLNGDFNRSGDGGDFVKGSVEKENSYSGIPTPVKENTALRLGLSPNPAKQTLQVNIGQQAGKENLLSFISITNAAGTRVLATFSNKSTAVLDVSQLKPGIYYLSVTTDKKNIITKAFLKE